MVIETVKETDIGKRRPKKLTEERISGIFEKRKVYIENRKEYRATKRGEKIEAIKKVESAVESAVESTVEVQKKEKAKIGISSGFTGEGYFDTTSPRKKGESIEPPIEDSGGVCYNEEKNVDLTFDDETGEFVEAHVNGIKLNL